MMENETTTRNGQIAEIARLRGAIEYMDAECARCWQLNETLQAQLDAAALNAVPTDKIETGRDAIDYVGKIANRLGIDDPAAVSRGKYHLERVGEAVLTEIERLQTR